MARSHQLQRSAPHRTKRVQGCLSPCCGGPETGGSGGGRRQYWGILVLLSVTFTSLYLLIYLRATLHTPSMFLSPGLTKSTQRSSNLDDSHDSNTNLSKELSTVPFQRHNSTSALSPRVWKEKIFNGSLPALLTLFSTWSDAKPLRNVTLRNWAKLRPFVQPVLFTNDSDTARQAKNMGWETMPVSKTAVGVPVLKYMYLDAMKRFNSSLYGFANGDILFLETLIDTLLAILTDRSLPLRPLLAVGQRTNVPNVTVAETLTFDTITKVAKVRGKLFSVMAEDFFIVSRLFEWDKIPEVVIGRPGYDNFLVWYAIQQRYVVVDVTKTVLAVHQTTKSGNFEGMSRANSSHNLKMLKKLYKQVPYTAGVTSCAPWFTLRSPSGTLAVKKRETRGKHCR